jgi:F-type H+-transporting ATPase subunit a
MEELTHTTTEEITHTAASVEASHVAEPAHAEEGGHGFSHEAALFAEPIVHVGGFPITNALITSWAAVLIIVALAVAIRMSIKTIPGKLQHAFEIFIEGALSIGDQVTNSRKITERVFPIAASIFFFVLINNWLGIFPLTSFGIIEHNAFIPFIRSGTADINTTVALAVISVIGANIFGIVAIGGWKMFNKYINVMSLVNAIKKIKKEPTALVVAPVQLFVGLIEIIGEIAKVASLSFRLFGNVFAGEVLLASIAGIMAYGAPVPFLFLEIMVGFVQAFIFGMLTIVYFTIAASDHDEHDESHDAHGHEEETTHHMSSNFNEEKKVAISN